MLPYLYILIDISELTCVFSPLQDKMELFETLNGTLVVSNQEVDAGNIKKFLKDNKKNFPKGTQFKIYTGVHGTNKGEMIDQGDKMYNDVCSAIDDWIDEEEATDKGRWWKEMKFELPQPQHIIEKKGMLTGRLSR